MNTERTGVRRVVRRWAVLPLIGFLAACAQDSVSDPAANGVEVVGIAVQPSTATLEPAQGQQFQAAGITQSGATVATTVRWAASGGTIDQNGMFQAAAEPGQFQITATHTVRSWLSDTAAVTIESNEAGVVSLVVLPSQVTIPVNDSTDFDAFGLTATGDSVEVDVEWTTDGSGNVQKMGKAKGRFKSGSAPGRRRVIARDSIGNADTAIVDVSDVAVASVQIDPNVVDLLEDETSQLVATTRDADGNVLTGRIVTWASSNNAVATVDGGGLVTAVTEGSATVTATSEGQTGTAAITVQRAPVASVSVSPSSLTVLVGRTAQLTATPRDANGGALSGRFVSWSSNNPQVATVSAAGVVTSVAVGTATITATSEGVTGTAAFTASDVAVATVEVSPSSADLLVGETAQFNAITRDQFGNQLANRFVTWSSSNSAVMSVNQDGLVTANGAGTANLVATSEGQNGTASVTVTVPAVASVDVSPSSPSLPVGQTVQLTATPRDAGGNPLAGRPVSWSSSNTSVATVTSSGLVTALAVGSATISATSEGQTGTAAVTVTQVPVASVDVSPSSVTVQAGQTRQLTATPRDAAGNPLSGRTVSWSSSNTNVATVNGSGLVTAVATGNATIRATSEGQTGTASVTVSSVPVASVDVTPSSPSLTVGATIQLAATPRDAAGNALTGRTVSWTTGNAGVATVSGSGLVTATGVGNTQIRATSEGVTGTASVAVTAAGAATVQITPASAALNVGATIQLTATVRDGAGNALPGQTVTWSTSAAGVATVSGSGLVTAQGGGAAVITARSDGASGTASIQVTTGTRADLAEPVYNPASPGHVLHFYDNFANYTTPSEMEQVGTNPDRVGGTWQLRGYFNGDFEEPDPYTGEQSIRITYIPAGSERRNDGGISINPSDYVNDTGNEEVVVIEYAYRELGPNVYQGKIMDFNGGQNSIGRFDYNNGVAWEMGGTAAPRCADDPLCSRYYAGTDDANLTPRFPGLPPEAGRAGGDAVRHVQLRTDGTNMAAVDPHGSVTAGYRQNRNWGLGPGRYDLMNNRDMRGQGNSPTQMPWMVLKIRFTKEAAGWQYGQGRIEHWVGETPGALTKVIEYVGDPGQFDDGAVFVGPRNRNILSANVNLLWPQGIGSPPNTSVLIGYLRVWSHPRFN